MIRQKVAGTYESPEPQPIPQFAFERQAAEQQARVLPIATNVLPVSEESEPRHSKKRDRRHLAHIPNESGTGSHFHNYGMANVNPPNPDLFMTTFNVKSPTGVNPHTVMKGRIRPFVMAEFARPRPAAAVKIHQPAFYGTAKEVPASHRTDMDGPFWMYWPSEKPFPPQYAGLEKVVRGKTE
jgi:hypothetical protein